MSYQVCTRCIIDTTVPGAKFDARGECSYCGLHDKLDKQYPLNEKGKKTFSGIIGKIKATGKNKRYDCVIGVSGGRDSTYTLYLSKQLGLRPLAVHFNDGFGNPVAGENMKKAAEKLKVELRVITSDWRQSKDLKLAFLKASTPDIELGTDIGIATALYSTCVKEHIGFILAGHSFRTEGISPLEWNYLDGRYLKNVHRIFGTVELSAWKPEEPGFHLDIPQMFYYTVLKRIKTIPVLYYLDYVRKDADELLKKELGWTYPGAHYYDDLYQSLMNYIYRIKFKMDRRRFNYSALIRSGQMPRDEALERLKQVYVIEDPEIVDLCIKRLGITREEIEGYLKEAPKTFRDYPTSYNYIRLLKPLIKAASRLNIVPGTAYAKYFECI